MSARWTAASIRVRLTAWYAAVFAVMLIVYATATFLAVRHGFRVQFDHQLQEDFERIEAWLKRVPEADVFWAAEPAGHAEAIERAYDLWSANGEQLSRSWPPSVLPPPVTTPALGRREYESLDVNGTRWRTLTGPTSIDRRERLLRVARSEDPLRQQLSEVLLVLALGLPLAVALAGVGGYVLARRTLAPIDQLGADARRITADRLHERLPVANQHDEIGRLAAVINEAFARLETSFDRLRRFTADASHELRTPLAVIRGIGEAGLAKPRTPPEYREAIGGMLEEVDRVTSLVDTLLRLSHADAGTARLARERMDLGELARDVAASLAILGEERGQSLNVDAPDPAPVSSDRLLLREALANIVDNAIKYSPPGSAIDVAVRIDGGQAVLSVADQGPGVAPEHRERIFDRFFRVDDGRSRDLGGTGLGLALAKWAVEVNGGRVTVGERPGGGAVFRVAMPLAPTAGLDSVTPII